MKLNFGGRTDDAIIRVCDEKGASSESREFLDFVRICIHMAHTHPSSQDSVNLCVEMCILLFLLGLDQLLSPKQSGRGETT